jgi:hypothetical protein
MFHDEEPLDRACESRKSNPDNARVGSPDGKGFVVDLQRVSLPGIQGRKLFSFRPFLLLVAQLPLALAANLHAG